MADYARQADAALKSVDLREALDQCEIEREDLRKSHGHLRSIMAAMYEGLVLIDRDYRIQEANSGFLRQYGLSREQVVGRRCHKISHGLDRPCAAPDHCCPAAEVMKTKEPISVEHTHKDAQGGDLFVEVSAFPLFDGDGEVEFIAEVSRDITERRKGEAEHTRREKLLAALEMAGAACHELNQPLQLISVYSERLLDGAEQDTQAAIAKIADQVDRMARITRRLQHITRYETKDYVDGVKILDLDAE